MKKQEYQVRSDLAIHKKGLKLVNTTKLDNIMVKSYKTKNYDYTNLLFNNLETKDSKNVIIKHLTKILKEYYYKYSLAKNSKILIIGLGNQNIVSDSLGPKVVSKVHATAYYQKLGLGFNYPEVYTFIPGVTKNTGMNAFTSIRALTKELNPNILIVIDSLISDSINYLNKLIQITDSGVTPGSGISFHQTEISQKTIKVPVIVIGVPTAIEASTIIKDALELKSRKFSFKKGYDFIATPKETDIFISEISTIIALSIDNSLNTKTI